MTGASRRETSDPSISRSGDYAECTARQRDNAPSDELMTNISVGDAVVRRFLDECQARSLAPTTITDRRRVLRRLAEWAGQPILYLDENQLRDWQVGESRRVLPQTLHGYLVAVRSFYAWAKVRGMLDVDPAAVLDLPRLPKRLPDPIAEDVYRRCVLDAPPDMAAILGLAGFAGLRACEIARLAWPAVRWADRTLRLDGKGAKERIVPAEGELPGLLAALGARRGPVIPRLDGHAGHNTAHTISQRVNRWLHANGCDWTLHKCRHRFATVVVAKTGNVIAAQRLLGHSSLSTTQIYVAVDPEQLRAAARAAGEFGAA